MFDEELNSDYDLYSEHCLANLVISESRRWQVFVAVNNYSLSYGGDCLLNK